MATTKDAACYDVVYRESPPYATAIKLYWPTTKKKRGGWEPASNSNKHVKNFFLDAKNARKVGFDRDGVPKVINDYKQIFAWILRDVKKYDTPKAWTPTRGAVTFCKIKSGQ